MDAELQVGRSAEHGSGAGGSAEPRPRGPAKAQSSGGQCVDVREGGGTPPTTLPLVCSPSRQQQQ